MASINLYLDTRRQRDDGTYPIKINVRHVGKFLVNTKMYSSRENWDDKIGYNKKEPNFKPKNVVLRKMFNSIEELLISLENDGKLRSTSDKKLKSEIEALISGASIQNRGKTFIDYLDLFIAMKKNSNTRDIYTMTRNKIALFDEGCTFVTMDYKWLTEFESFLLDEEELKINACGIHMRNIRAVFNWAIDEEYTQCYPFRKFKIKKEETRKRSLTAEQLRTLRDYPCEEYQIRYRDIFMLMFYLIGINAADLFMAKPEQVVNGRLEYKRAKTGRLYSILLQPEAKAILQKYKGHNYLLNIMDEYSNYKDFLHRMGIALKDIGETKRVGRGGKKVRTPLFPEISSYWSRHTWATIAAELDVPKEVIAHALGHSWVLNTTTDIYIRFDEKKVDEANRKVIDFIGNEEKATE